MRKLLHQKANNLQTIYDLSERISGLLQGLGDEQTFERVLELLSERKVKMDEINDLDRRVSFLQDSGYEPADNDEIPRIEAEREVIRALLLKINETDQKNNQRIAAVRELLMEDLKDVKESKRSISAYASPHEDEEGQQVDMRR